MYSKWYGTQDRHTGPQERRTSSTRHYPWAVIACNLCDYVTSRTNKGKDGKNHGYDRLWKHAMKMHPQEYAALIKEAEKERRQAEAAREAKAR